MKDLAELISQIGVSSVMALLLWGFLKDYIEKDNARRSEEISYYQTQIDKEVAMASKEREDFKEERSEFAQERKETMEKFLEQLHTITSITNNNSENISRLTYKMDEIKEDVDDIKRTLNDKE